MLLISDAFDLITGQRAACAPLLGQTCGMTVVGAKHLQLKRASMAKHISKISACSFIYNRGRSSDKLAPLSIHREAL